MSSFIWVLYTLKFKNRACFTGAFVIGDEVLLGAVPMEDMDVVVSPATQSLIVNPESPNRAMSVVKKLLAKPSIMNQAISGSCDPVSGTR